MNGVIESAMDRLTEKTLDNEGFVEYDYLIEYMRTMQDNEMHCHVVVQGANGLGKSSVMLSLLKSYDNKPLWEHKILFAHNDIIDFLDTLESSYNEIIGIDEMKNFMNYLEFNTEESKQLQKQVEYSRFKQNIMVGCVRDIEDVNISYRKSQAQILIWIFDKYDKRQKGPKSYGGVFLANPLLKIEDKFNMSIFNWARSIKDVKYLCEHYSRTFLGYIYAEDINNILTEEEIKYYKDNQLKGASVASERSKEKIKLKMIKHNINTLKYLDIPEFLKRNTNSNTNNSNNP